MKYRILFFLMFLFIGNIAGTEAVAQSKCSRCHGTGNMKTRFGMSTHGVTNRKVKCQYCGQWILVSEVHYDTCTSCGGTGRSGTSSSRRSSRNQATSDDWMSYLTPQEYAIVTEIKESMKPQRKYIPCKACKSTGTCQRCGGIQTALDLDAPFHCPQCGGSGYCIACNGKGNQGYMVVDPPNYKYLQQRLAYYCKIATNRQLGYK